MEISKRSEGASLSKWHSKGATVNGGNGNGKWKRKAEKGNGRHSNTYTVQAINARTHAMSDPTPLVFSVPAEDLETE